MYSDFLTTLNFALGVTGPIFVMVCLGIALKYWQIIDAPFMDKASRLVFVVALPALLFISLVRTDIKTLVNLPFLAVAGFATVLVFVLLSLSAPIFVRNKRDRGVFIQGAFRGNLAIVGLALCANAYGDAGLAVASILMSILTLLYNILSVYTLSASLDREGKLSVVGIVLDVLKNPLVIAILAGIAVNLLRVPIHPIALKAGDYLAQMTLPLALLCIGGTISLRELRSSTGVASMSVLAKLVVTPAITVYLAHLFGFSGMELGILFLMVGTPCAAAAYVMVQAMGGNATLAANIVVVSTLLSLVTISAGIVLLEFANLI